MKPYLKKLHSKRCWKRYSLCKKVKYYMKPFLYHLGEVWSQPLPLPTVVKVIYSTVILTLLFMPIIYPAILCLLTYSVSQFCIERNLEMKFPDNFDLLGLITGVYATEAQGLYAKAIQLKFDRMFILGSSLVSLIDYIRIAFTFQET